MIILGIPLLILGVILVVILLATWETIFCVFLDKLGITLGNKYGLNATLLTPSNPLSDLIGKSAVATTDLLPSGKVQMMDKKYDAIAMEGSINKGQQVTIRKTQSNTLYVEHS